MTKQEIIESLQVCISIIQTTENTFVTNKLTQVAEALIDDFNKSDYYVEQIKQVLNYDETMENLNNIKI